MNYEFLKQIPIAHRGLHSKNVPENTLAAFCAAMEHGYAIETDIRASKDGALVLLHDDTLTRLFGVDKAVHECTQEQLRTLSVQGERVVFLEDLLTLVNGRVPLLLEIKTVKHLKNGRYLDAIAETLKEYDGEYAVQSFHPFLVKGYKKRCPDVPCGILATAMHKKQDFPNPFLWKLQAHFIKNMSFNGIVKPDFISYRLEDLPVKKMQKFKGVRLAWVARSLQSERIARLYADNVIFEDYLPEF